MFHWKNALSTHSRDSSISRDQVTRVVGPASAGFARTEEVGLTETSRFHIAKASTVIAWCAVCAVCLIGST